MSPFCNNRIDALNIITHSWLRVKYPVQRSKKWERLVLCRKICLFSISSTINSVPRSAQTEGDDFLQVWMSPLLQLITFLLCETRVSSPASRIETDPIWLLLNFWLIQCFQKFSSLLIRMQILYFQI